MQKSKFYAGCPLSLRRVLDKLALMGQRLRLWSVRPSVDDDFCRWHQNYESRIVNYRSYKGCSPNHSSTQSYHNLLVRRIVM